VVTNLFYSYRSYINVLVYDLHSTHSKPLKQHWRYRSKIKVLNLQINPAVNMIDDDNKYVKKILLKLYSYVSL